MKTKLISLAIALLSLAKLSMAQEPISTLTINPNIAPILQGSLLCGDEVKRISSVPITLKDKWYVNSKAELDTLKREIQLNYYFKTPDASLPFVNPLRDTLVTTLNEYLPKNLSLHLNEANLSWTFNETYFLDDTLVSKIPMLSLYNVEVNPFQKCFTVEKTCGKLQVVRHEVRPICSGYGVISKYGISLNKTVTYSEKQGIKDTIYNTIAELSFEDSIAQYAVVCLAVGNIVRRDTLNFSNITDRVFNDFKIIEKKTQVVYCVTTPCNPVEYNLVYNLGEVNLPLCLQTGIETELPQNELVYPNPATDKLFVKGVSEITLTDVLGNKSTLKGNGEFDIDRLKTGLYLLNYEINGSNYSTKILIQ